MVKVRPWMKQPEKNCKEWEVDIRFRWPQTRTWYRERVKSPVTSKSGSKAWGEEREAALLGRGPAPKGPPPAPATPTLKEFGPRWIRDYCRANRLKPATINRRELALKHYLYPLLGEKRLGELGATDYDLLKAVALDRPKPLAPGTVNLMLLLLHKMLATAKDWGLIPEAPRPKLLKLPRVEVACYEPEEYERLVDAARGLDHQTYLVLLLAGDAGLRLGEICALERGDVDMKRGRLVISHNLSDGEESTPKGNKSRVVELTARLKAALKTQLGNHIGRRVLYHPGRKRELYRQLVARWVGKAELAAGFSDEAGATGAVHKLRHTFGTQLAAAGVPVREIQALMGHESLKTTEIYLHLAEAYRGRAIRLLEESRGSLEK
jgi:integrase